MGSWYVLYYDFYDGDRVKYKKVKPIKGFAVASHTGEVNLESFRMTKKAVKEIYFWQLCAVKAKIVPVTVRVKVGK